ncbi:hypothetical protein EVAR_73055_1 [Eumeta japonica]|uniref:Uncharacterized protein n=1 Tax=Eumeta variegata TaxID=151549 RepID=A0A4C1TFL6_EUMVA|nr:hypothetical protein EVAR_73055_1 [Eumeta japonica]
MENVKERHQKVRTNERGITTLSWCESLVAEMLASSEGERGTLHKPCLAEEENYPAPAKVLRGSCLYSNEAY